MEKCSHFVESLVARLAGGSANFTVTDTFRIAKNTVNTPQNAIKVVEFRLAQLALKKKKMKNFKNMLKKLNGITVCKLLKLCVKN